MTDWQKIEEAVARAADIPPQKREEWLAEFCGGDAVLRGEIESLLAFEEQAEDFLEKPLAPYASGILPGDEPNLSGKMFGHYQIIREIGRGGMGAVFLATRADGEFEQQAALKIMRATFVDPELEHRFRRERQILAGLNHPNIARLLDGGVSERGEPFLVMEFIEGETLLEFAEKRKLETPERLKLFLKICQAVAFAHRNLIVHRDIKPTNILVTAEGIPKLLDFGLAKALDESLSDENQTQTAFRALTPAYASPEQIRGERVTTSSDIYSLGKVLAELLGLESSKLKAQSSKPKSPETAEIAAHPTRRLEPLKGDLQNITAMALREEPERRYPSVESLAEDIENFLGGKPVKARPSTFRYRASKFIRRNRYAVAAVCLILLTLAGGITATLWQARRAEAQRMKAEKRFADVRRLANSFLFEIHPQIENLPGAMTARETLVRRALEYLDSLAQESADDRQLQRELAAAYEKVGDVQGKPNQPNLGDLKGALESYRKAQNLRLAVFEEFPNETEVASELANNYEQIAGMLWWSSDTAGAENLYQKALEMRLRLVSANPQTPDFRWKLAKLQMQYGDVPAWNKETEKALALYRAALENLQTLAAAEAANAALQGDLARCHTRLADAHKLSGKFPEAVRETAAAISIYETLTAAHPEDLKQRRGLWVAYFRQCEIRLLQGDAANSLADCGKLPAISESLLAAEPKNVITMQDLAVSYNLYGESLALQKRFDEALKNFEKSITSVRRLAETADDKSEYERDIALNYISITKVRLRQGEFEAAFEAQKKAREVLAGVVGSDPQNPEPQINLAAVERLTGEIYAKQNKLPEARAAFGRALGILRKLEQENSLNPNDRKSIAELENELARIG